MTSLRLFIVLALTTSITGCSLPMHRMQEVFAEDVRLTVGRTLEELTCCSGRFLYGRQPVETKQLEDRHLLHVYAHYKRYQVEGHYRTCDVALEFAPDAAGTLRVVKATAEGDGCYRAY